MPTVEQRFEIIFKQTQISQCNLFHGNQRKSSPSTSCFTSNPPANEILRSREDQSNSLQMSSNNRDLTQPIQVIGVFMGCVSLTLGCKARILRGKSDLL